MTNSNKPWQLLGGDCLKVLATLPTESVQTCITSPPYWGLRDYGSEGQLGIEATPEAYVAKIVDVFREVRRVLRDDGTLWLNLGDSYAHSQPGRNRNGTGGQIVRPYGDSSLGRVQDGDATKKHWLKNKDLVGIPWRVAFALQADGWYLRQDIIWHKPNPMPESTTDRCTKAHEYIFLMTKSAQYFYDAEAIKEKSSSFAEGIKTKIKFGGEKYGDLEDKLFRTKSGNEYISAGTRNKRSVWTITTKPFKEAHFATFPPDLIEPCVLAGTSEIGACTQCKTPYERILEKGDIPERSTRDNTLGVIPGRDKTTRLNSVEMKVIPSKTIGWKQMCNCNSDTVEPCIVLDPFNGAGTTGVVAVQHNRSYIGIELNPDYLEMANKRIQKTRDGITLPLPL